MQEMFCFQCQQTAHNTGCDGKAGVCGKKADTANYQDEVIGALIGLAQAVQAGAGPPPPPEQGLERGGCTPPPTTTTKTKRPRTKKTIR